MRTAKAQGWPPSQMWMCYPNRNPSEIFWLDVVLAEGLQEYEDSLCGGCGIPSWISFDPYNMGEISADDKTICLGCKAKAVYHEKHKKMRPGQLLRLINKFFLPKAPKN